MDHRLRNRLVVGRIHDGPLDRAGPGLRLRGVHRGQNQRHRQHHSGCRASHEQPPRNNAELLRANGEAETYDQEIRPPGIGVPVAPVRSDCEQRPNDHGRRDEGTEDHQPEDVGTEAVVMWRWSQASLRPPPHHDSLGAYVLWLVILSALITTAVVIGSLFAIAADGRHGNPDPWWAYLLVVGFGLAIGPEQFRIVAWRLLMRRSTAGVMLTVTLVLAAMDAAQAQAGSRTIKG